MKQEHFADRVRNRLRGIYDDFPEILLNDLLNEIETVRSTLTPGDNKWSERDCYLITYGNSIVTPDEYPLKTLGLFLRNFVGDAISHVHILPFFPYTSDDGFSVVDYRVVNPHLGSWNDVSDIGRNYRLMSDLVINHISQKSEWFMNYLNGVKPGKGYFIEVDPGTDLSKVIRPRSLPLLTTFRTIQGPRQVWTTFSADQVDLNFANPEVLVEMLKIFLFYISKDIRTIRLDAIAFLWKQIGTSCLHQPRTHEVVKLMREIKDSLDPARILITETNVPNSENLSYFGTGDEADMVYQFSLPPLLLHALFAGTSHYLNSWMSSVSELPTGCTFFNFTASHDGIGVRPLEGILPPDQIAALTSAIKNNGGVLSTRRNSDGTDTAYEMNITYLDALKSTCEGPDKYQLERFICSQTIMMSLRGVPAFYIQSLLGTVNDTERVMRTGMPRSINRKKWDAVELTGLLKGNTTNAYIFNELMRRIRIRQMEKSFSPEAPQHLYDAGDELLMFSRGRNHELVVCANLRPRVNTFDLSQIHSSLPGAYNLLAPGTRVDKLVRMMPYEVIWLKK